jgi:leucyl/phenylalanyl-tRNA--protein transferase
VVVPARLARTIRQEKFEVRVDSDFDGVIAGCAASRPGRRTTWINDRIAELYGELFEMGHCHTIETWLDGRLVGGLYGVHLGGAFFGESMFSTERDASKVALVYLAARLIAGGFRLLDTQFVTPHLRQFGAEEITRPAFHRLLSEALQLYCGFHELPDDAGGSLVLQLVSQTSNTGCSTP